MNSNCIRICNGFREMKNLQIKKIKKKLSHIKNQWSSVLNVQNNVLTAELELCVCEKHRKMYYIS